MMLRDGNADSKLLDFVRKSSDSNRLTRPIDLHRKWNFVSDIRLEKGNLIWRVAEPKRLGNHWIFDGELQRQVVSTRRQAKQAGNGVLDDFLALHNGKDEAILKYAHTWGVMELCFHNLPACHEFSLGVPLRLPGSVPARPRTRGPHVFDPDPRQCSPVGVEPLKTWRFFSG